ncbi:MAG: hypothetical protein AAFP04_04100 [Myxococcota bacterium]
MKESVPTESKTFKTCKPLSAAHRRGIRWFSSITHAVENDVAGQPIKSLQHCIQFYSCYAESGDGRYLNLCEDFLKYAIKGLDRARI